MENELLEQNLKCPICLNIVTEPFESSCCGHLFCKKCTKNITNICPICRSNKVKFRENAFIKNFMDNIYVDCCYGCEKSLPISQLKVHRFFCEKSTFKCTVNNCNVEATKNEIFKHMKECHSDQMVILAEHYASVKNIFDKHSLIEQIRSINEEKKDKVFNGNSYSDIQSFLNNFNK
jgi:E3 ubiquitin-protein ligase NRDP1